MEHFGNKNATELSRNVIKKKLWMRKNVKLLINYLKKEKTKNLEH